MKYNMISDLAESETDSILTFISEQNINLSPFIYTNLYKYRHNLEPFYHFYYTKRGSIYDLFISEYDNTVQIWCSDSMDIAELNKFLKNKKYKAIYAHPLLIKSLDKDLSETPGFILKLNNFKPDPLKLKPMYKYKQATELNEFNQSAEVIYLDSPSKQTKSSHQIASRLIERYNSDFGRSWIITYKDMVICHVATYAEAGHVAVIGGVSTHPDFRRQGLATYLTNYVCDILLQEQKIPYLFCYNEVALKIYIKLGFETISEWGLSLNCEDAE